jgi:hypothetical protein
MRRACGPRSCSIRNGIACRLHGRPRPEPLHVKSPQGLFSAGVRARAATVQNGGWGRAVKGTFGLLASFLPGRAPETRAPHCPQVTAPGCGSAQAAAGPNPDQGSGPWVKAFPSGPKTGPGPGPLQTARVILNTAAFVKFFFKWSPMPPTRGRPAQQYFCPGQLQLCTGPQPQLALAGGGGGWGAPLGGPRRPL